MSMIFIGSTTKLWVGSVFSSQRTGGISLNYLPMSILWWSLTGTMLEARGLNWSWLEFLMIFCEFNSKFRNYFYSSRLVYTLSFPKSIHRNTVTVVSVGRVLVFILVLVLNELLSKRCLLVYSLVSKLIRLVWIEVLIYRLSVITISCWLRLLAIVCCDRKRNNIIDPGSVFGHFCSERFELIGIWCWWCIYCILIANCPHSDFWFVLYLC